MNKVLLLLTVLVLLGPATLRAQHPAPAPAGGHDGTAAADAHQEPGDDAAHAADEEHGMLAGLLWPTVNFAILAGGLWWL